MGEPAPAADAPSPAHRGWLNTAIEAFAEERSHAHVVSGMTASGVPQSTAEQIATEAREIKRRVFRKEALKTIGVGALWAGGGLAVTAATYAMAEGGGGYIITWGPVGWGVWTIGKGAMLWAKA